MNNRKITINYGEAYLDFIKRHPVARISRTGSEEFGYATFHEIHWSPHHTATVTLNLANTFISINEVIYLMMMERSRDTEVGLGINEISLQAGITAEDWISYDEARLKFHDILQGLLDKGWKRALSYSSPRFVGSDAMEYKLKQEEFYMLDPNYLPTLEQWKAMPNNTNLGSNMWVLHYNNQVYIEIDLKFIPHKTDPDKAAYLLFIKIHNAENEAQSYFDTEDKLDWQKNWIETKTEYLAMRQKAEIEGIKKGYAIDVHYLDYQIPPGEIQSQAQLDETIKSLTFKSGATVPRSGYYEATLLDYQPHYGTLKANPRRYVQYNQGDTFRQFGMGETTEPKIRWVFIVDSLPESVDESP